MPKWNHGFWKPCHLPQIALSALVLAACGPGGGSSKHTGGDAALVVTTDYDTGGCSAVATDDHRVSRDLLPAHSDAVCRWDPITGRMFLIGRLGADLIDVLDPDQSFALEREYSVGAGSNPYDIAIVSAGRAYVARFGSAALLVVDPLTGAQIGSVDLGPYADQDGIPEATSAITVGGEVYVTIARLVDFTPSGPGQMLVIDGASGRVSGPIDLSGPNPSAKLRLAKGRISIVEAGQYGQQDGGVELFDPSTKRPSGFVLTEAAAGGDINDAVLLEGKGYAVVAVSDGQGGMNTEVAAFDPATGQVTAVLDTGTGFVHAGLELSPDGRELWVADRRRERPGVRIFDTATDRELTAGPIDVGLPPFMICFAG